MDGKPSVAQIVEAAQRLQDAELRQVLEMLSAELKHRYKLADQIAAAALKETDWVETVIDGTKLPLGAKGHVVKIRRERVDVHFPDHGFFTVSAKMLRRTEKPTDGCPETQEGVGDPGTS